MSSFAGILIAVLALVVVGGLGWLLNNRFGSKSLEAMRQRADEAVRSARREGEKIKRKALLDAKEEVLRQRNKADHDLRSRKGQLGKREKDLKAASQALAEREQLARKLDEKLREDEAGVEAERANLDLSQKELEALVEESNDRLQRVSGMTREEARRQLLANLKAQTRLEAAQMIKEIKDEAQKNAETEATKIIALAVERCASEFSAERTVSQFDLPEGSDLKGRIIGQEGKNIRAFEQATGIQLLVDEESATVTLSGYNPVAREVARRVLETLVKDGNIHPRRIEELTRRNRKRLEEEMKRAGQETLKELNIRGVHGEMVKLLGRLKFRASYGQNARGQIIGDCDGLLKLI